jgi:hypothetical protein
MVLEDTNQGAKLIPIWRKYVLPLWRKFVLAQVFPTQTLNPNLT